MSGVGYHAAVGPFAPTAYPRFATDPRCACKGTDPDQWFPNRSEVVAAVAPLRVICHGCPLRRECREWAVSQGHWLHGVWGGGLTRVERLKLARRRARAARLAGGGDGVMSEHVVSDLERAVRRAAIAAKVRRIYRRRALSRPIPGWWLR